MKHHDKTVEQQIQTFWSANFEKGTTVLEMPFSREDHLMYKLLQDSAKLVNGRFQLPLPWRSEVTSLPNNRSVALNRLMCPKGRFTKNPSLKEGYINTIDEYLSKGHASKVNFSTDKCDDVFVWYLPHHPVIHPYKPYKVRIVFDCAAKCKGVRLNDASMQGPNLANSVIGVLTRFHKDRVVLVVDIESMFHQVQVDPKDTSALRFLWWPEGNMDDEPTEYNMNVHVFGATSSPTCASFCLRQVAQEFGCMCQPFTSEIVKHNLYVDECLCSCKSETEAINLVQDLVKMLSRAGFRLKKRLSNSKRVLEAIPESERAKDLGCHESESSLATRVLGVQWKYQTDEFVFDIQVPQRPLTRRGLLSAVSSLFDPLGFVAPVTLFPKLLLQDLCKQGHSWDELLNEDEADDWTKWLRSFPHLSKLQIRCCLKPSEFKAISYELHFFSDALLRCYGSCCYLRMGDNAGHNYCSFIIGKARVAPLKAVSTPRLELTAAVLSVRFYLLVTKELDLPNCNCVFWTDSAATLQGIQNSTKRFPVFVANRLAIICEHTSTSSLKYVSSKLNPADFAPRGISAELFSHSHAWLQAVVDIQNWGPEAKF